VTFLWVIVRVELTENGSVNNNCISKNSVLTNESWEAILDEVAKSLSFVTLDLSACIKSDSNAGGGLRVDGTFDPMPGNIEGKEKINALILPNEAIKIEEATHHYNSYSQFLWISVFKSFINLKTITGANISCIDSSAFRSCKSIKNINFPEAGSIDEFAFADCTSLTSASFPNVISIKKCAFQNCKALGNADFPKTLNIAQEAFDGCTSLSNVNFPQVVSFGVNVFGHSGSKTMTITLGNSIPNMWGNLFDGVTSSKTINLKYPSTESSYNYSWKKKFIGGNNYINLMAESILP